MQISAKADYAMRALLVLAAVPEGTSVKGQTIADTQDMPAKFVENTLGDLKRSGLVQSQRGSSGGYRLGRPAHLITVADVVRAVDGPLAEVRGRRPETVAYEGAAENLQQVWIAARASLRAVLEHVTLAQIVNDELPANITSIVDTPDAWKVH
jgi:Rrf2 family protein